MSNFTFPSEDVLRARQKLVLDHFHHEVRHAWSDVLATLKKIPATGSKHRTRITAYFIFDADEKLVIERIYFDPAHHPEAAPQKPRRSKAAPSIEARTSHRRHARNVRRTARSPSHLDGHAGRVALTPDHFDRTKSVHAQ